MLQQKSKVKKTKAEHHLTTITTNGHKKRERERPKVGSLLNNIQSIMLKIEILVLHDQNFLFL